MTNQKFKVGDKVKLLSDCSGFCKGKIYTLAKDVGGLFLTKSRGDYHSDNSCTEGSCGKKYWQLVKPKTPKKEIAKKPVVQFKAGDTYMNYADLTPFPDYKKASGLGLKVGDLCVLVVTGKEEYGASIGQIVEFVYDDNSVNPYFSSPQILKKNYNRISIRFNILAPLPALTKKGNPKIREWNKRTEFTHKSGFKIENDKITWPDGTTQTFAEFAKKYNTIRQVYRKLSAVKNSFHD